MFIILSFPAGSVVKNLTANAGDMGMILGSGKFPGGWNGNPLQYSCLGNPMTEEPGGLQTVEPQRVRHDWVTEHRELYSVSYNNL